MPSEHKSAVLITGAAKRVGKELALFFARAGHDIALHYHHSQEEAAALKREIERLGVQAETFAQDVAALDALPGLVTRALDRFPHCGVLINNASIFTRQPFLESTPEEYARQFTVNFAAPAFLTQAFATQRKEKGGVVINMIDTAITAESHAYFFYILAKKALADFTRMAARELAPGIRVNGICPGKLMPTVDGLFGEDYMEKNAHRQPLKRYANVSEVAKAAQALVDNEAVTGQLIFVDGGEHLL